MDRLPKPTPASPGNEPRALVRAAPGRLVRRLAKVIGVTIVLGYLTICLAMFSLQARLIYFPDRDYWTTPKEAGLAFDDLTLKTADGLSIAAWYVPHAAAKGTVLFCHGNAGNIADRLESLKSFHYLGYNVLIFDYRGYGRSEGKPSEPGLYRDAEAAWRYVVETRATRPESVVLFGESLGGAVAIDLAARHTPGALVVQSTFTSLVDIGQRQYPFLPIGLLCTQRYASIDKVLSITCPKLFIHGTQDELVPLANGRRLFDAAAEPKDFLQTPGGHNDGGFEHNMECIRRLGDWLNRLQLGKN